MKKLVYLIVVIMALGLIIAGCLPTVPPTEQGELGILTKQLPEGVYVASNSYGDCEEIDLEITRITFQGTSNPSLWEQWWFDGGPILTTVGILYTQVHYGIGILNAPITLIIRDSSDNIVSTEIEFSSCRGYNLCFPGWCFQRKNGFTFETNVCGWPAGHYIAELTAQVGDFTTSFTHQYFEFDITEADIESFDCPPLLIEVEIDIKPQSCPNPLNVKSKGVLPVAILGTEDFDVTEVDLATVRLEGISPLRWDLEDVATPKEESEECNSLGSDGVLDLTLKFDIQEVVATLGEVSDGEYRILTLTGNLLDGTPIEGEDSVLILNKIKPEK